jgi:hypothetical protein
VPRAEDVAALDVAVDAVAHVHVGEPCGRGGIIMFLIIKII